MSRSSFRWQLGHCKGTCGSLVVCAALCLFGVSEEVQPDTDLDPDFDVSLESCRSPYWDRVQELLQTQTLQDPSPATVAQLLEEEETFGGALSAGCEVGRLLLSAWHLVFCSTEERAWHLSQHFGAGFFALPWRPHPPWPLFRALSRLQARIRADPPGTYPPSRCDALDQADLGTATDEAEALLQGLLTPRRAPAVAAAAAQFLLVADAGAACPLALAAAFWALAAPRSPREAVLPLLRRGEVVAKSWQPGGASLPFLELFTTRWPLWELLAQVEVELQWVPELGPADALEQEVRWPSRAGESQSHSQMQDGTSRPLLDPLEPFCPHSERSSLSRGLENQRVEAIVVYGRRDRAEILHRYLLRNLRVNGGVLDRVSFVVFVAMEEDLAFLQQIVRSHAPIYDIPQVTGRRLAKIYSICTDPETVYIKIDDDVVYLSDEAIPAMVHERLRGRCGIVSANVINHAILSAVHQDIGAVRTFLPGEPKEGEGSGSGSGSEAAGKNGWFRADDALPLGAIMKHAQSDCVWKLWECAAWMHESFLSRLADGTECAYDFGWHNFHAHGHGIFKNGKLVPLAYSRWSINMIALRVQDLAEASLQDLAEDDESELAVMVHHRTGRHACAVGQALVAHFAYARQEEGLLENTDLLWRYGNLSLRS